MENRFFEQDINEGLTIQTAQDLPVMTDLQDLSPRTPQDMLSGMPADLADD